MMRSKFTHSPSTAPEQRRKGNELQYFSFIVAYDESGKGTDGQRLGGEKEQRTMARRREGMKKDDEEERRPRMREDLIIS